jgi:Na+/proline symporter
LTNAAGGIVVGLVTKYAGSVRKGFALIFGIFISGVFQKQVSKEQWIGGLLAGVSLWMHAVHPPVVEQKKKKDNNEDTQRESVRKRKSFMWGGFLPQSMRVQLGMDSAIKGQPETQIASVLDGANARMYP